MNPKSVRYWQDVQAEEQYTTQSVTITRADILEFAADFDPQPYHLDADAANDSIFGGLCASGWHVCAVMMRLLTDTFSEEGICQLGSSGVPSLRWRKPVFAGDTLSSKIIVVDKRSAHSDSPFGYITCDVEVINQEGDQVINMTTTMLIGLKESTNG